jgi:hypothetical protein
MSVWEAIVTSSDSGFVQQGLRRLGVGLHGELSESEHAWRADRVWAATSRTSRTKHRRSFVLLIIETLAYAEFPRSTGLEDNLNLADG